jgi:hypothetical protein
MKTSEQIRNRRVNGRLFTEPANKFRMYGCSIVALRLPVLNQILCVDRQSDVLLHAQDYGSFSGKMPILQAKYLMKELHLKIVTEITYAFGYHGEREWIYSKGILMLRNIWTPCTHQL